MKAVVNAGPLMALGKLGLIQLLPSLYHPVLIPSDVYEEVVVRGLERDQPDAYAVQLALARGQVEVRKMAEIPLAESIRGLPLHPGEKAAIQLALIETADWVLLDDWLARESARQFSLRVKGTLGVIVTAYHQDSLTKREVEIIFQSITHSSLAAESPHSPKLAWFPADHTASPRGTPTRRARSPCAAA